MLCLMQVVNILQKCYGLLVMSLFQFVKLKMHTALWTIWVVCMNCCQGVAIFRASLSEPSELNGGFIIYMHIYLYLSYIFCMSV